MTQKEVLELVAKDDWCILTMYAPYCHLWLMGIKIHETRPKGTRKVVPLKLFIQTAQKELDIHGRSLADKYLGVDYQPDYGKIIGYCTLTATIKMTDELIQQQSPQELEIGNWEVGRVAWVSGNRIFLPTPIPARGVQAAPWKMPESLKQVVIRNNPNDF